MNAISTKINHLSCKTLAEQITAAGFQCLDVAAAKRGDFRSKRDEVDIEVRMITGWMPKAFEFLELRHKLVPYHGVAELRRILGKPLDDESNQG